MWQGEPVKVEYGYSIVMRNEEKPLMWYNFHCRILGYAAIPAIKVFYEGSHFVIANHYGIGHLKLKLGGWPYMSHFSLPDDSFTEDDKFIITEHNEVLFKTQKTISDMWFESNFPEEYKKLKSLKDKIR